MRSLILGAVVLALLVSGVLLVGRLLPATREGRAEAIIAASPDRILAVIADVTAQPAWRDGLRAVTRTDTGWDEVTARGERIAFRAEEMTETRVVLRFASDRGYSGRWEAVLTPVVGGTRIAVVETATVSAPLGRIIARLMFDPAEFSARYLQALKAQAEG